MVYLLSYIFPYLVAGQSGDGKVVCISREPAWLTQHKEEHGAQTRQHKLLNIGV